MPKILFEINYNIFPEKREEYVKTINELKESQKETSNISYSVFESKKISNNFTEMYICDNEEDFDSLEDNQSERTMELTQRLFDEFVKDKKVVYSTKYEV
ncbi:MAG TPA: hypothetical protein PKA90_05715 [Ignavibacteria bacterium]|nr:hypothetical protein [Ignavibacteria bacterium]HMR39910.1 hypothetical protein [Ignavibacteria bacterium]